MSNWEELVNRNILQNSVTIWCSFLFAAKGTSVLFSLLFNHRSEILLSLQDILDDKVASHILASHIVQIQLMG